MDIDVIIPVYNGADFVSDALSSALGQSLPPRRVIVVDDGSTDATPVILSAVRDPRLLVLRKANGGLSSARNAGLQAAESDWVAFLDADDVWLPRKLEFQSLVVRASTPDLALVYCDYDEIDAAGHPMERGAGSFRLDPTVRGRVIARLWEGNLVCSSGSGVLVRRAIFDEVGSFDEGLKICEDWDMWLRIAEAGTFDYCPRVLVHLRRHPDSMQARSAKRILAGEMEVYLKQAKAHPRCLSAIRSRVRYRLHRTPWPDVVNFFRPADRQWRRARRRLLGPCPGLRFALILFHELLRRLAIKARAFAR
jgi:glycosyltransferase involved in cell wall biosynthesis